METRPEKIYYSKLEQEEMENPNLNIANVIKASRERKQ